MDHQSVRAPAQIATPEMPSTGGTNVPWFQAVVFGTLPENEDFSCSETIVLPGRHATSEAAWGAVRTALNAGGAKLIGGEIRACA